MQIQSIIRIEQGLQLLLMGHRRVNLEEVTAFGPPLSVRVNHWKKPVRVESTAVKAYRNELLLAVRCVFVCAPSIRAPALPLTHHTHTPTRTRTRAHVHARARAHTIPVQ